MKIHLVILFAVIAICSGERKRFLLNQYKYEIPVYNTPPRPRYDLPITPGKPAEVYGVPLEYQEVVQPPVQVVQPVVSKYKYNIVPPVTASVIKFPQLVRYPIEEKQKKILPAVPKQNTVSTYKYKIEPSEGQVVESAPLAPYPAAIPVTKVVEPVVNSYKFTIEPSVESSLPLAPYPPAVLPPSVPFAPYPPAVPISSKPLISQYKYNIEPPVKPSLPLAPYPPAVPTAPVQKLPVSVNKYKYTIEQPQLPSGPYPPAVITPEVVQSVPIVNKYTYKIEPSVISSLQSAPYPAAVPAPVSPSVFKPILTVSPVKKIQRPVVNQYSYRVESPVTKIETSPSNKKIEIEKTVKSPASKPAVFQYQYVLPHEEVHKVQESQVVIPKPHAVYGVPL